MSFTSSDACSHAIFLLLALVLMLVFIADVGTRTAISETIGMIEAIEKYFPMYSWFTFFSIVLVNHIAGTDWAVIG